MGRQGSKVIPTRVDGARKNVEVQSGTWPHDTSEHCQKGVHRKYYIRRSIGGRQAFCLAEQGDQAGGEAYWRDATPPPLMAVPTRKSIRQQVTAGSHPSYRHEEHASPKGCWFESGLRSQSFQ
jgi:hypothetical protein